MRYFFPLALLLTLGVALIAAGPVNAWKRHGSTPPVITNIVATSIDTTTEQITWTTDVLSNTVVKYDVNSGVPYAYSQSNGVVVTSHSLVLTELSPGTLYYYVVQSYGGVSAEQTFTTVAAAAPVIGSITAVSVDFQHETINWTTDQPSSSVVHYGLTSGYGSTASDAALVTSHSVPLSGLSGSTTYHFNVASTATTGTTTSGDNTFLSAVAPAPTISSIVASSLSATSEQITWTTNTASDSTVNYGLTSGYGSLLTSGSLVTSHSLNLTQLTPSTLYHYDVASGGATSADQNFTTVAGAENLGLRIFVHNFPLNDQGLVNSQANGSQWIPTDPYVCGSQTVVGWNYVAPNGAYFTGATSGSTLTVTNLSGQTIHTGDAVAISGETGLPTISSVPGGGSSSTSNGSYGLSVSQPVIAAADAWTMQENWTDTDAFLAYYDQYGKKTEFLFASSFAQTPQLMQHPAGRFTVNISYTGSSASPTYAVNVTGLTGTGNQICGSSVMGANTPFSGVTPFTSTPGGAYCNTVDGSYGVDSIITAAGSQTAVTVTPTLSATPNYVLNAGSFVDSYTYTPGSLNPTSQANVSAWWCHSDRGTAVNQPSPWSANYLGRFYQTPWKRFVADVVAHYGSDQRVATLHFPTGGMESFPQTSPDSNCQTMLNDMGYATTQGNGKSAWFNWGSDFVSYIAGLSSPVQIEMDVNGNAQYDPDWVTHMSTIIQANGLLTGSNGFPTQNNGQAFADSLWGVFCPTSGPNRLCYAETESIGKQSSPSDYINIILPDAQGYLTSPTPPTNSYGIHTLHVYAPEEQYTWSNKSGFATYNASFQAYFASLNPPPVQGPSCRIPAGGS